jgi:hypothetical protein
VGCRYCATEADPTEQEEDNWAASAAVAEEAVVRPTSAELQQVRATAESRIAMLRERCQAALGARWFPAVHEYLTEVRAGEEGAPDMHPATAAIHFNPSRGFTCHSCIVRVH